MEGKFVRLILFLILSFGYVTVVFSDEGLCKFNPKETSQIESKRHISSSENGLKKLMDVKLSWSDNSFEFTLSWIHMFLGVSALFAVGGIFFLVVALLKRKAILMRNHAVAEVVEQAVHDIRSPLAALHTALKDLKELPEERRVMIRTATNRVSDIANNLLEKYKIEEGSSEGSKKQKNLKAELVSDLLECLVSEKRLQVKERSVEFVLEIANNTRNCFVNLDHEKFKRTLFNLINNAVEAIETTKGLVQVVLAKQYGDLVIKVVDNGKGITEDTLQKIRQGKITSDKRGSFGLGVFSTIQNIRNWNGSYDIQSRVGQGTTFTITLPIAQEPHWFQSAIVLARNTHIIVLDDDESIHNIWQTHFHDLVKNNLATLGHFYEPLAFSEYCKTLRSEHDLFLVDYELRDSKETGLDLIERLGLKKQAILVTSRYEKEDIRKRTEELGIRIIPKNFAPYIPVSVEKNPTAMEQPELIFIDDDKFLTNAWEIRALSVNKKIATFNCSEDFKKVMHCYNKNIPIYIDSDLKEEVPGEVFAKFLYEQGFQTIYLATGYDKDRFGRMPWIKDVVSKETPF